MKKGSLSTMLSKKKVTNWLEKLYLIDKISQGIKLIHNAGYLHCDIHGGNFFYESTSEIYISDFGISIPASESAKHTKPRGVILYMAPEVLKRGSYTKESDIYSLGFLFWEIITQRKAYVSESVDEVDEFLVMKICEGLRPEFEESTPRVLKALIESCWDADPKERPTIEYINFVIKSMIFFLENTREDMVDELHSKTRSEEDESNNHSKTSNDSYGNIVFK
jgi:serine/threonine protein kinase